MQAPGPAVESLLISGIEPVVCDKYENFQVTCDQQNLESQNIPLNMTTLSENRTSNEQRSGGNTKAKSKRTATTT